MKSIFFYFTIILLINNALILAKSDDLKSLQKEKKKLEKTIENLNKELENALDKKNLVEKENLEMKNNISYLTDMVSQLTKENNNTLDDNIMKKGNMTKSDLIIDLKQILKQMPDYDNINTIIKLETEREEELREDVKQKLKEFDFTNKEIEEIRKDIKENFKSKLGELELKVESIEKNITFNKEYIYKIEQEKEKTTHSRNLKKQGNSKIIEPNCVNRNSCSVCLEDPKCVWCGKTKRCVSGDMFGPIDGSCSDYKYTSCENKCNYDNCTECIMNSDCGWCSSSKKCSETLSGKSIGTICNGEFININNQGRCGSHSIFKAK